MSEYKTPWPESLFDVYYDYAWISRSVYDPMQARVIANRIGWRALIGGRVFEYFKALPAPVSDDGVLITAIEGYGVFLGPVSRIVSDDGSTVDYLYEKILMRKRKNYNDNR